MVLVMTFLSDDHHMYIPPAQMISRVMVRSFLLIICLMFYFGEGV